MNQTQVESYLRNMRELIRTNGWKELLEEFYEQIDLLNDLSSINKVEELWYRKGQIDALTRLTNLEFELEAIEEEVESFYEGT